MAQSFSVPSKITPTFIINGIPSNEIAVTDRGLHYGDGIFETMEVHEKKVPHLEKHLARMQLGCKQLRIEFTDWQILFDEVSHFIQGIETRAVLKIIITRGRGGRGYRPPAKVNCTRILGLYPWPSYPNHYYEDGVDVYVCRLRISKQPLLAGVKHLNRLENVLARNEFNEQTHAEGLLLDSDNHVIEATMSNVFMVKNQIIATPDLSTCGVAGIMRQRVLDYTESNGLAHEIKTMSYQELLSADEIFLTNSIIGIWPVKSIEHSSFRIGSMTQQLLNALKLRTL